jgi:putative YphP/YqiW family bacilliredoxin
MYPAELVAPMKAELEDNGFMSLVSSSDVEQAIGAGKGTCLVVVNSVCGCAARNARPAAIASVHNDKRPDRLLTVFAGVDTDAVAKAREYFQPYPPSSPSIALFKDGELVHFIERHQIEGRPAELIASNLISAYNEFC